MGGKAPGRVPGTCVALLIAMSVSPPFGLRADDTLSDGAQLFERQQYQDAKTVLEQRISKNPADAGAQYFLGRAYFMLCDYERAIEHLNRAVNLDKTQPDYYFWLGRAYGEKAQRSGLLKQAVLANKIRSAFERAVVLDSAHAEARTGLGNFYAQAPGFMGGSLDAAAEQAQALTLLDPLKGGLLSARILEEQKDPVAAEATYKELEKRYGNLPGASRLYGAYGKFLLRQRRIDDAIAKLEKQVTLEPSKLSAHFNLAAAFEAAGRSRDAADEYAKAAKMNPTCKPPKKH